MKRAKKAVFIFLIVIAMVSISVIAFLQYKFRTNSKPESVNMGSEMSMGSQQRADHHAVSIDSYKLQDTTAPVKNYTLTARVIKHQGSSDQWSYNGVVPGPEIRVTQGDHVHITLINNLPVSTSIHWHGIQVPNAADGVAGLTQDAVKPGQSYTYDFIAKDIGTYWYHSHTSTSEQLPKGLIGSLIVDSKNPSQVDHDYTLIYHDENKQLSVLQIIWARIQQIIEHKQIGQAIEVNGKHIEVLSAKPGQIVRVRIINASGGDITGLPLKIVPIGTSYQVIALDGHDIHEPQQITSQILPIGQGQRYDVLFTMPVGAVKFVDLLNGETATIGQGTIAIPSNVAQFPFFDLTQYGTATATATTSASNFDATYPIILGNHPGFRYGSIELIHTMSGKAFPDAPIITVQEGQTIHLHLVNATDEYHPIHLHGHIFTVLKVNEKPVIGSPIHVDTILVPPHQTADVAFIANNPGLWMLHCHILIHAEFGMDMMVVYPNIFTPYTIGTKSGNFPD